MKLAFYNEVENVTVRVREQLERARQRLYHERAQIIAARLGYSGSSSRANPVSLPTNRIPMNAANLAPRAPTSMTSQRPPLLRPSGNVAPNPSNPFVSTSTAGGWIYQDVNMLCGDRINLNESLCECDYILAINLLPWDQARKYPCLPPLATVPFPVFSLIYGLHLSESEMRTLL